MADTIDVFLGEIKCALHRFQPKPGDVFVITVPGEITEETVRQIKSTWKRNIPDFDVNVCILDNGMKIGLSPS
jgi:hypothetical protein